MSKLNDPSVAERPRAAVSQPDARLVPVLLSVSKSTRALLGLKLGELGFHNGQDELLLALDETDPACVSTLANELCVRPSTVSKMLDRLIGAGLVERTADGRDGRRTMVGITPLGKGARARLVAMREKLEAELVMALAEEAPAVAATMSEVSANLKARLGRHR